MSYRLPEAPAGTEPIETGDLVLCDYRLPDVRQPWNGYVWVGVIETPGEDIAAWNGYNTEAQYCRASGKLPVRYATHHQHDRVESLRRLSDPDVQAWLAALQGECPSLLPIMPESKQ